MDIIDLGVETFTRTPPPSPRRMSVGLSFALNNGRVSCSPSPFDSRSGSPTPETGQTYLFPEFGMYDTAISANSSRRTSIMSISGRSTPLPTWTPIPASEQNLTFTVDEDNRIATTKPLEQFDADQTKTNDEDLYPNCDVNVWLRSCVAEVGDPIEGTESGQIPTWLNGTLLRNGPGNLKVGDMRFNHLFDSSALLHRFRIAAGKVTYQSRFLQSQAYKKNTAAQRIVVTEFGTKAVPDPCHTIFDRVATMFKPGECSSDNAMISIYPFGDEYFAFTESPIIHRINPDNLRTEKRLNVSDYVGIVNHTSHPHVMSDGTVYNLGMSVTKTGPTYNIICFPHGENMFKDAHIVASVPARWKLHPCYMHTFGITDNYFLIVEQPLSVSVSSMLKCQFKNDPMASSLKWFPEKQTFIYVLDRDTGHLAYTFVAEAFFYLHIINQYEENDHIVLDICCYKDPGMLNCMYIETMENMQHNPDYAKMFRGRPLRFVLPLPERNTPYSIKNRKLQSSMSLRNLFSMFSVRSFDELASPVIERKLSFREYEDVHTINKSVGALSNLVTLRNTKATAYRMPDGMVFCKPELLCNLGCETPRVYYEEHLGRKYRYFYAISSDVDALNPGTLIKVDVQRKSRATWCETNCYPSEPIFVPAPNPVSEDDGVVLAAMVWGRNEENRVGLLVLCAKTWTELGRSEFRTSGPVPKCLHGWFTSNTTQQRGDTT